MSTKPKRIPKMSEVMTPFPWSVGLNDSLLRARSIMVEHGIRHLPVTKDGQLVGVVTDRDIHLVESVFTDVKERQALTVNDLSVVDTFSVELAEGLDVVLREMADRHIGSALVVRDQKLVGIFTVTDACGQFSDFLRAMFPKGKDDQAA